MMILQGDGVKTSRAFWQALAGAFLVIVADQWTKWLVVAKFLLPPNLYFGFGDWLENTAAVEAALVPENFRVVELAPFLNFVMVWNQGVSFGLFDNGDGGAVFLSGLSLLIVCGMLAWLWQAREKHLLFALPLIIGGALGNVQDRLRFGAVADFIDVHVAGYHWPAFNLADSAIVLGALLIAGGTFFADRGKDTDIKTRRP